MNSQIRAILMLAVLLCVPAGVWADQEPERVFVRELAQQVLIPGYTRFAHDTRALQAVTGLECAGGKPNLAVLREYWRRAMRAWMQVEPFAFGPVVRDSMDFKLHFWPVRRSKLVPLLSEASNVEALADYSVAGKGLAGIEYVLFDPDLQADAEARCRYLRPVTTRLAADAQRVASAWSVDGDWYRTWTEYGVDNPEFLGVQDALNRVIAILVQHSELILKDKLGAPLGEARHGAGPARPGKVESRRAGAALHNLDANLLAWLAVLGEDGDGLLATLLARHDAARLAGDMRKRMTALRTRLGDAEAPLARLLERDPAWVNGTYDDFRQLRSDWVEVARRLNVPQGFNSSDGD